jgi:hypothetical protein
VKQLYVQYKRPFGMFVNVVSSVAEPNHSYTALGNKNLMELGVWSQSSIMLQLRLHQNHAYRFSGSGSASLVVY